MLFFVTVVKVCYTIYTAMEENNPSPIPPRIVFYDGDCGLCQNAIQFLLNCDHHGRLHYAPLQGETYANLSHPFKPEVKEALDGEGTLVYARGEDLLFRSTAALKALGDTGGIWKMSFTLLLIPRFLRDFVYRIIAHNRLRLFGKGDSCRLPTPEESERFLA